MNKLSEIDQLRPGSVVFPSRYYSERYGGTANDLYLVIAITGSKMPWQPRLTLLSPDGEVVEFHCINLRRERDNRNVDNDTGQS